MIRLFTALEISDEAAERLARLQRGLDGARWIERPDFHITLRFAGDVAEDVADDIDEALAEISMHPFEIELEGLGEFGGKRPHTLWAGVKPSEPLRILQGRHESAMRRVGLKPETRNFTPHVTIARLGRVETGAAYNFIRANSPFAAPPFTAERFTLFSAKTSTGGGPYVAEKRYPDFGWEEDE
ncbi:MAG: RNA 2',3'-cyclic phosphodiesterase [Parvibaculum sp.]|uniref:RNA 2',3'-cyclic phosphodiesterase n=1 Tax=Parvibaculum sp. TaxID=2024848 RepID=UPI0032ECC680